MDKNLLKELANGNTQKVNSNNNSVKETIIMNTNEKKEITKVLQISREFIRDFCKTASKEDCEWITSTMARYIMENGETRYFAPFRMEFAKKFLPQLVSKKTKAKKVSLIDEIYAIAQSKDA